MVTCIVRNGGPGLIDIKNTQRITNKDPNTIHQTGLCAFFVEFNMCSRGQLLGLPSNAESSRLICSQSLIAVQQEMSGNTGYRELISTSVMQSSATGATLNGILTTFQNESASQQDTLQLSLNTRISQVEQDTAHNLNQEKTSLENRMDTEVSTLNANLATKTQVITDLTTLRTAVDQNLAQAVAPLAIKNEVESNLTSAISTAVSPLATTTSMNSAISTAVSPLATTASVTSAISTAVSPLASTASVTSAILSAVAPLATTTSMNSAISTAVSPLASTTSVTSAILSAVAPLATTTSMNSAISTAVSGLSTTDIYTRVGALKADLVTFLKWYRMSYPNSTLPTFTSFTLPPSASVSDPLITEVNGRALPLYAGMPSYVVMPTFDKLTTPLAVDEPRMVAGNTSDFNVWPGILQDYVDKINAVIDDSEFFANVRFDPIRNYKPLGDRLFYNASWCSNYACSMLLPSLKAFKSIFLNTGYATPDQAYNGTIGVPSGDTLRRNMVATLKRMALVYFHPTWDGLSYTSLQQLYCKTAVTIPLSWNAYYMFTYPCNNTDIYEIPQMHSTPMMVGSNYQFEWDDTAQSTNVINPVPSAPKAYPGAFPSL